MRKLLITKTNLLKAACLLAVLLPLLILLGLIAITLKQALPRLNMHFLSGFPSRLATEAGILPALAGSLWLMLLTALIALPIGIGSAVYLEEYAGKNRITALIELNIANLAGIPSIVYGLLGLELFARVLNLGRSLLTGACTMALLILPMVIIAAREALKTVAPTLREACLALGAPKWRTIWHVVLPHALPGILTGIILSLARAIGETAPLITIGALTYVAFVPDSLMSPFTALPIQIFNWISRPQSDFHMNAAAGIIVLLSMMLGMNALAIWLRERLNRKARQLS